MPTLSPEILEKYEHRRIPRYTSYPTAPHFGPAVDAGTYRTWLGRVSAQAHLSVYLHVPYCAQMCWYCGCHTKITRRYDPISRYVQSLEREIDTVGVGAAGGPCRGAGRCATSTGAAARPIWSRQTISSD